MAKDIERVSVNKFESALLPDNIVTETLSGTDDVTIQIKKTIPLEDMISFVQEVVESCIDGETGEYIPEAYDFAVRVGVLTRYANFAMPANMDKQYMLVYNTRAFEQVMAVINLTQFNDIVRAIDRKIKYMLDVMASSAVSKINEVISKFGDIAATAEQAFAGANPEDIKTVMQGVSKLNSMDEEKIAKVILHSGTSDEVAVEEK